MLDTALKGSRKYWAFLALLLGVIAVGVFCWLREHELGSGPTSGLGRDIPWGLHVGQLTFFVGVAASAVMVVLPYYLHDYKEFARITVIGEFLAVAAVVVSMLSVFSIMGQPGRVFYVLLFPTPNSIIFWDMVVLSTYLGLNLVCGWTVLSAERQGIAAPKWVKPFIYWAIVWAPSIHMVTAFLYAGLPGKHHWMTALTAVHFLATAFAAGPALLIVLGVLIKKLSRFDPGTRALQKLAEIATYALILHIFFVGLEFFTAFYSQNPGHMRTLEFLYVGLDGNRRLVPVMWISSALAVLGLILLAVPALRRHEKTLVTGALAVFFSIWLDKGLAFVVAGFVPDSFERVNDYWPHWNEFLVAAGVWAVGVLVLTVLYKVAITVKEEAVFDKYGQCQLRDAEKVQ
ncbi:MAG: polysulfide reductase NrfD [Polyangiaceae bacterium]|nr:polysulfide reductase NrfD [Polyangiaceae bacterium]